MKKLIKSLSLALSVLVLGQPSFAFENNQDVLVEKEGKWFRGWIVESIDNDHSLVAFNWNADRMEVVANHLLKENKYSAIEPEKKLVNGWTSDQIGVWHLVRALNNDLMAAGSGSGQIQLFNPESMYPLPVQFPVLNKLTALALSPDGQTLATCQYSGEVTIFQASTATRLHSFKPVAHCENLAFGSNDSLAIVGSPLQAPNDHAFWLFSLQSKVLSSPFSQRPMTQRNLSALSFSNNGQYLALGASNREKGIRVYAVQGLEASLSKELKTGGDISALSFAKDVNYLAGGGSDQSVSLWKWQTGQKFWNSPWRKGRSDFLGALSFSPDDASIAVCGSGAGIPVSVYRKGNGKITAELGESFSMTCSGLVFNRSGNALYTVRHLYSNFGELVLKRYSL